MGSPSSPRKVLFIHGGGEGAYETDALLAAALQEALGPTYELHFPRMPEEEEATYADWRARIAAELSAGTDEIVLVGHSLGGAILVKYLAEERVERPIAGLYLLAAPYIARDGGWRFDDLSLPQDVEGELGGVPRMFLYHGRDDEIVPFAHLALYRARFPGAIGRAFSGRGHQFDNDLSEVAADVREGEVGP